MKFMKKLFIVILLLATCQAYAMQKADHIDKIELENLRAAAQGGNTEAQFGLGTYYFKKSLQTTDLKEKAQFALEALTWYKRSAKRNMTSYEGMGHCYKELSKALFESHPAESAKSYKQSMDCYEKSAITGSVAAQELLANSYYDLACKGQEESCMPEAIKWFNKAALQGSAVAHLCLGNIYENRIKKADKQDKLENINQAIKYYTPIALTDIGIQAKLGQLYEMKREFVLDDPQNESLIKAMCWWKMAADRGHALAQHNLAICFNTARKLASESEMKAILEKASLDLLKSASRQGLKESSILRSDIKQEVAICATCGGKNATARCGKCKIVKYCGPDCQKANWPQHKLECTKSSVL